jgi:tight adherence protein C
MSAILDSLGGLDWQMGLVGLMAMLAVLAGAAAIRATGAPTRDAVIDRLDRAGGGSATPRSTADAPDRGRERFWAMLVRPLAAMARPSRADELGRLRSRLIQGGMRSPFAMEFFVASKLLLAALPTMLVLHINSRVVDGLVFPYDVAAAVWTCSVGFLLPSMWLSSRIKSRQGTIERALPDAMDLMVTCVEAGLGLDAALARVADELAAATPLLASELNLTFLEIQASIPRRDAFRRLSERTGVEDLKQLSAVLTQTEMFGTSIARALRIHSDSMRVRRMQRAEEKANMVGVKMTLPLILCILPALMAVVLGPAVVSIMTHVIGDGN